MEERGCCLLSLLCPGRVCGWKWLCRGARQGQVLRAALATVNDLGRMLVIVLAQILAKSRLEY
jgi:hypothetical protein